MKLETDFQTINSVKVDAHSFRVTLNILRHSDCCPADLVEAVDRLIQRGWNRHALDVDDMEAIYTIVDNNLVKRALREWNVDTSRMRDWGFPAWKGFEPDWWDGHSHSVDCRLCGHRDNRYEFPLVNAINGHEIWTGSTCIVKYGVTVDGDGCAETALAKLRECMGKSKKAQTRAQWQARYTTHENDIGEIRKALPIANRRYVPWEYHRAVDEDGQQILPPNFDSQRRALGKWARAAVKYYDKNGYLTVQRTGEMYVDLDDNPSTTSTYAPGQMLATARSIVAAWATVTANDPREIRKRKAAEYWTTFAIENPKMNDYQRNSVAYWKSRGLLLDDLYPRYRDLVDEIRAANVAPDPAKDRAAKIKAARKLKKLPWS